MPTATVDYSPPPAPRNGSLERYTDTTEGSVVFYSCDPGLVPELWMRAMCMEDGWSPNPANLHCSPGILEYSMNKTYNSVVIGLLAIA